MSARTQSIGDGHVARGLDLPPDLYVEVAGISTRYWRAGRSGKTLVLIHGLGGFLENWAWNLPKLATGHQVYALDLVGFGRSEKPRQVYSLRGFADFVRAFMDTQKIDSATLVGNSMGGAVALEFARRYPHQVQSLVLVSSAGFGERSSTFLELAAVPGLGELITRAPRWAMSRVLRAIVHDPTILKPEMIAKALEIGTLPGARRFFLSTLRHMKLEAHQARAGGAALLRKLRAIQVPVMIIWGEQDRVLPVEDGYLAKRVLPQADLIVFPECGHVPMIERADEFNERVLGFLAKLPA